MRKGIVVILRAIPALPCTFQFYTTPRCAEVVAPYDIAIGLYLIHGKTVDICPYEAKNYVHNCNLIKINGEVFLAVFLCYFKT